MKIHEFQAKQIFKEYQIPIPEGDVTVDHHHAGLVTLRQGLLRNQLLGEIVMEIARFHGD